MTDDPPAAGAEGEANGDLFLPGRGPGDQQAGDVGACDEQDASDDPEQHAQRLGKLLADGGASVRGGQEIHGALEELLPCVGRRVAERGVEHFLFERAVEVGCNVVSACSRVTPGLSRPKTLTHRLRRLSMSSQFGVISAFIVIGMRRLGT